MVGRHLPARRDPEHRQSAVVRERLRVAPGSAGDAGAATQRQRHCALRRVAAAHADANQRLARGGNRGPRGEQRHGERSRLGRRGSGCGWLRCGRRGARERNPGAGPLQGRAAADAAHHVGVRTEVAQVRPVPLGGPEGEAVTPYEVGDLSLPNHGVREETDQVRLSQRLRSLRRDEHREAERHETSEPASHGRGHCERSNRRSAASTSA